MLEYDSSKMQVLEGVIDETANKVKCLVVKADNSKGVPHTDEDPFRNYYSENDVIEPPIPIHNLQFLKTISSILPSCVNAMKVSIDMTGYHFLPRIPTEATPPDLISKVAKEEVTLLNFFNNCVYSTEFPNFISLRTRTRDDIETTGNGYWEIVRENKPKSMPNNELPPIKYIKHVLPQTIRLTKKGNELVSVKTKSVHYVSTVDEEGNYEEVGLDPILYSSPRTMKVPYRFETKKTEKKIKFRKFIQLIDGKETYFKEFGDPRTMNKDTGEYVKPGKIKKSQEATEIYHFKIYDGSTPYGVPRTVGVILGITGERTAEEISWSSLRNNNVPAIAVTVSGGIVTQDTVNRIQEFVDQQISGNFNYSSFLILEMEPDEDDLGSKSKGKIEIQPLTQYQHTDSLWAEYKKQQRENIREAFRLAPIYFGRVGEVGKAAHESKKITDEQVFAPERRMFDEFINTMILPNITKNGITYWEYESNTPDLTDNESLIKTTAVSERTGALTPAIARMVLERVLNKPLGPVTGVAPDVPFSMTMAAGMKKEGDSVAGGGRASSLSGLVAEEGEQTMETQDGFRGTNPLTQLNVPGEESLRRDGIIPESDTIGHEISKEDEEEPFLDDETIMLLRNELNNEMKKRKGWDRE